MTELVHHNIMHYNDIKLSSLVGNIRLNTAQDNKVYINSENSTLTINENCALGFGKIPDFGNVGDVLISDGEFGSKWSNKYTNLDDSFLRSCKKKRWQLQTSKSYRYKKEYMQVLL